MSRISLSKWVEEIREDLQRGVFAARDRAADSHPLRFTLSEVILEVNVVSEQSEGADTKIKFWVLEMGASDTQKESQTQKVTIKLLADAPMG